MTGGFGPGRNTGQCNDCKYQISFHGTFSDEFKKTGPGATAYGKTAVQGHTKKSVTRHPAIMAHSVTAQMRNRLFLKVMSYDSRLAVVG